VGDNVHETEIFRDLVVSNRFVVRDRRLHSIEI
jgi:hypothetical protein